MPARPDPWLEVVTIIDARLAELTNTLRQFEPWGLPGREAGLPSPRYQKGGTLTAPEQRQIELVTTQIRLLTDLRETLVHRQSQAQSPWFRRGSCADAAQRRSCERQRAWCSSSSASPLSWVSC
jgi:hypothetical protein